MDGDKGELWVACGVRSVEADVDGDGEAAHMEEWTELEHMADVALERHWDHSTR